MIENEVLRRVVVVPGVATYLRGLEYEGYVREVGNRQGRPLFEVTPKGRERTQKLRDEVAKLRGR